MSAHNYQKKWNHKGWQPGNGCGQNSTHTELCINQRTQKPDPEHLTRKRKRSSPSTANQTPYSEEFTIYCNCALHSYVRHDLLGPALLDNMRQCPCSFHAPADDDVKETRDGDTFYQNDPVATQSSRCWELPLTPTPIELPITLTPEEANRSCRAMGCKALIIELMSRCRAPYFTMESPFIMHSIYLAMVLDLDFGLVYAHFRAFKCLKDAAVCGSASSMDCDTIALFTSDSWPADKAVQELVMISCLLAQLPVVDPKNGILLESTYKPDPPSNTDSLEYFMNHPYSRMPRRIWDLGANRVIMSKSIRRSEYACVNCLSNTTVRPGYVIPEFWAITHSWVTPEEREDILSNVNMNQWKIPIPQHVTLESVLSEVRALISRHYNFQQFVSYCWLDILCLRQDDHVGPGFVEGLQVRSDCVLRTILLRREQRNKVKQQVQLKRSAVI